MRTRSRDVPAASYCLMRVRAFSMVRGVSNESRASTSVETRPATICEDVQPELDAQPIDRAPHDRVLRAVGARVLLGPGERVVDQGRVLAHLRRGHEERRVRRRVAGLELLDRVDVARVGDDDRHLGELLQE